MFAKKALSIVSAAAMTLASFASLASAADTSNPVALAPASTAKVTIVKYVDGQQATAGAVDNAAFSMHLKFTGTEDNFELGPTGVNTADPYKIVETLPSGNNSFEGYENIYGAVGPTCASKLPYVLAGYTMGDTLSGAASASPSMTMPSFSNITSNKYVIVWNTSCASPNPTPTTTPSTIHLVKVICPTYGDIAGNATAENFDATGGNFNQLNNYASSTPHFPNPYIAKPISLSEISQNCTKTAGWQFKFSTDQGQTTGVSTTAATGANGQVDVAVSSLTPLQQNALNNGGLWVSEVMQGGATFGTIRCFNDANNGDNLEVINFDGSTPPANTYCIAYNVAPKITNTANVKAYKVVCEKEKYLPNWGTASNGSRPSDITPTVVANFVANSNGKCKYASNWKFEYGDPSVTPIAGSSIGSAGAPWKPFDTATGGTAATPAMLSLSNTSTMPSFLWVREDLQTGFVPFSDASGTAAHPDDKSAEMFCHVDGLNYDNFDEVNGPLDPGTTYYCVALNAVKNSDDTWQGSNHWNLPFNSMSDYNQGHGNGTSTIPNILNLPNFPSFPKFPKFPSFPNFPGFGH